MRALILTPDRNTHLFDYTGAFKPEAKRLSDVLRLDGFEVEIVPIDVSKPMAVRLAQSIAAINRSKPLAHLAIVSHGWKDGVQIGATRKTVGPFADAIASVAAPELASVLFACSTGSTDKPGAPGGDGGFADVMRDALCKRGILAHVDAHDTKGHTTMNPRVMRFDSCGPEGGTGGAWIIAPEEPLFKKWRARLGQGSLRFKFPRITRAEIRAELER